MLRLRGPTPAFTWDLEDCMGTQAVVSVRGSAVWCNCCSLEGGTALETAGPQDLWRAFVFINRYSMKCLQYWRVSLSSLAGPIKSHEMLFMWLYTNCFTAWCCYLSRYCVKHRKVRGLIPGKACAELVWPSSRVSGLPTSQPTVAPRTPPTTNNNTTFGLKTELLHSSAKHYFLVSLYLTMMWKVKAFHNIQTTKEGCYSAPLPPPRTTNGSKNGQVFQVWYLYHTTI